MSSKCFFLLFLKAYIYCFSLQAQQTENIAHGTVCSMFYDSKVMNQWRPVRVYTPPSYGTSPDRRYPVLYIQHGGGEDEKGWIDKGNLDQILNKLITSGHTEEMIAVMANGHISTSGQLLGYNREGMKPFQDELLQSIIPFIERIFRVIPEGDQRALAGLSMGGGQAFYVGLQNTSVFSHIGVFGSGIFGGIGSKSHFDPEEEMPGLISGCEKYNKDLSTFYISVGTDDPRYIPTKQAVEQMQKSGLAIVFKTFKGNHEWKVWKDSLHDFLPYLFKP